METLKKELQQDSDIWKILHIIKELELKDSWLCAGSVRNFIWNRSSGQPGFDPETDVDIIFYDPDVSYEETCQLEKQLLQVYPQYRWELKKTCTSIILEQPPTSILKMLCQNIPKLVPQVVFD
ncbi:hypothetical protein ABID27_001967 [Streptococcus gallinaceus]|uniref:Uncharacterized protein n=1 Tax=Streptococcus gallinaceus TaxID=165758 RepID=A0ABV2JN24_9STRE